jgi:putative oxidoreductase
MTPTMTNGLALVGRILLILLFLDSGYGKIGGFAGTAGYIGSAGLPMPEVVAGAALVVELAAGVMVAIGWKTRWAAAALAVFTLIATFFFHNYWAMPQAQQAMQKLMFLKNLAIVGGLLLLMAFGPGRFSVDRR